MLLVGCLLLLLMASCGGGLYVLTAFIAWFLDAPTSFERYYWPSGGLESEGLLGDDRWGDKFFTGRWTYYYESGAKWKEGDWNRDRVGDWTYYHESGAILARGSFYGPGRAGSWTWWYENGQVSSEGSFNEMSYSNARGFRGGRAVGDWTRIASPLGRA